MAFQDITQLNLGNILQIAFSNGIRNQISQDFRDWEMIKRAKVSSSAARELRFMFQNSYGIGAVQWRDPGVSNRAFPAAQQAGIKEYSAKFKEINASIELEYNLWDRARTSPEKYAEPLALEIDSKSSASKRVLAGITYADGTGVLGTLAATAATVNAAGNVVFTLSTTSAARGHVGLFEYNDILVLKSVTGGASALVTSAATTYFSVVGKDRGLNQVELAPLDVNLAPVTVASITTPATAGDVFYRYGQPTFPDLTALGDYGTASEVIAGLESLTANDGRLIHGITMKGATAGTRQDCAANPIDVKYLQKVMDQVKINVGQDRYRWKMAVMAPETNSSFIESRETDRRFQSIEDNKRGVKVFAYVHGQDTLELTTSEYVAQNRLWILPETKAGEKVIEFHGSDFSTVKGQGMSDFNLKPGTNGYVNTMVSYLQAIGVVIVKHPAAIAVLTNFTNS